MGFAPTWLRQVSLLHKTTLTTDCRTVVIQPVMFDGVTAGRLGASVVDLRRVSKSGPLLFLR